MIYVLFVNSFEQFLLYLYIFPIQHFYYPEAWLSSAFYGLFYLANRPSLGRMSPFSWKYPISMHRAFIHLSLALLSSLQFHYGFAHTSFGSVCFYIAFNQNIVCHRFLIFVAVVSTKTYTIFRKNILGGSVVMSIDTNGRNRLNTLYLY